MKRWQFCTVVAIGVLCLVGTGLLMTLGRANQALQVELMKQQEVLNKGELSQRVGNSLLRDMAGAATKNPNIRNILVMQGYVNEGGANAAPTPGGAK
jgi:hypothetical protein